MDCPIATLDTHLVSEQRSIDRSIRGGNTVLLVSTSVLGAIVDLWYKFFVSLNHMY